MIENDIDCFRMGASPARQGGSALRRLLSAVFPRKYSGKIERRTSLGTQMDSLIDALQAEVPPDKIIKSGDKIDVHRTTWQGREVVVKRYKHTGLIHSIRHTIKRSRASRAWANGRRLLGLGVATPPPLAYIDEHHGPLLWQSCLITKYVESPTLHSVLRDDRVPDGRKRRLIHQVLKVIDRLEQHGISHGDMEYTNILCDGTRLVLTDLDGMEVHRFAWLHRQRRGRDIARFLRGIAQVPNSETESNGPAEQGLGPSHREPTFVKLKLDAGTLWVNPNWRNDELEKVLAAGPDDLAEHYRLESVQSAESSRVWRFPVTFQGALKHVYFKEYLPRSVLDSLKQVFRPARAIRAMKAASVLARHGFHTPEILAVGQTRKGLLRRTSFMATLEAVNARPIYEYFTPEPGGEAPLSLRSRRDLLRQFGQTVGRMHASNIVHGDLRLGNVLVGRTDRDWTFFFIDNERTRVLRKLPARLQVKNLVQVNMKLPDTLTDMGRMRFFREYWAENGGSESQKMTLIDMIMKRTRRRTSNEKQMARKLRQCLTTNADYVRLNTAGHVAVFRRRFCQESKSLDFVERIDALMDQGHVLKDGDTSYVSRLSWNGNDVVVKRYNHKGLIHSLRHTIKRSRARRSWLHAHRLEVLGVATPRPLAYIEERKNAIVWKSYLVTEYVEGRELKLFLRDEEIGVEARAAVNQQVTDMLRTLGRYHITHGDLKHSNVLITESGCALTDLDAMRVHKWAWWFTVRKNRDMARLTRDWKSGSRR